MANNGKVNPSTWAGRGYALLVALLIGALCAQALAADFEAGMEAYERGDYAAALREFRPLAEQGNADAQAQLGVMYLWGFGVPEDAAEAAKWYRKAAEQGNAAAQARLAVMYFWGSGVPGDVAEAAKWYRKAAEQGHADAQYNLGFMYDLGNGVPKDAVQAYAWINIAAGQGYQLAEEGREAMAESMTREEISRAQQLAREYWKAYVEPFRD